MPSFFRSFVRETVRPFLLRLLSWTEHRETVSALRSPDVLKQEIRLPIAGVSATVWVLLTVVLFLKIGPGWGAAAAVLILSTALLVLFSLYIRLDHPDLRRDEDAVALLGVLVVAGVLAMELWSDAAGRSTWLSPYSFPLPAVGLLVAILLHPRLAAITTVALSLLFGIFNGFSLEAALIACFGGMTGVASALKIRARRHVSRACLGVAGGGAVAVLLVALMQGWTRADTLFAVKGVMFSAFLSGLLVLGLLPHLELFFSRLSLVRLLELSDVNHPLLQRLSREAPGTYHHSLIMASLAQAAAERIGANALLCRVGAYFHDIGKLLKPEYFVENQGALGNPHELLPPNMSRLVIQAHVKDGLALAQQHGLDRAIRDFISMHHGTSRIEYFYHRAIERSAEGETVDEDQYRYPGPRPLSRETAIVMMADSVEASARTVENPTRQRLREHVDRIVAHKMADGQFERIPLTFAEVEEVKDSFVNTLVGVYHARVRYPAAVATEPKPGPGARQ